MQNKGAIRLFAILFGVVCLYQLSFTVVTSLVEKDAQKYAKGDPQKEVFFLDSVASKPVYNLGVKKFTYKECKERQINLGLDLKGGMNVTLEISNADILKSLSNNNQDPTFQKAIAQAQKMQNSSQKDFITLFGEAFAQIDPNAKLAAIFNTFELKDRINFNSTNSQVLDVLRKESASAFDNSFNILRNRIDRFGVVQPNIQKLAATGRILVELPGVKEPERVRKLLQGSAKLEFWETYENSEIYPFLVQANERIKAITPSKEAATVAVDSLKTKKTETVAEPAKKDSTDALLSKLDKDTSTSLKNDSSKAKAQAAAKNGSAAEYPLFSVLRPNVQNNQIAAGSVVGYAHYSDTSKVNHYLTNPQVKSVFPRDVRFYWSVKPFKYDKSGNIFELHAIKVTGRDGRAPLDGSAVTNARADFGQNKAVAEVSMSMSGEGARTWARLTKDNIGRCIAIVLDDYVYSAPRVQSEIKGGSSSITGDFSIDEAKDLANILKSGKMPAPAHIIQEAVVGPTLGQEAINAGFASFIIAFIVVLFYMIFYYARAGWVADIALLVNLFFLIGILASIGAVLTLPGIAGIVLTMGMAVDANVIIYERIREELRAGKGVRLAISDGFRHAYSAIIDGQLTTLITGIILFIFGSGPIQGFATTLVIGILTSLFTAIFISRLVFERMLNQNKTISFSHPFTADVLHGVNINFMGVRKWFYIASSSLLLIGFVSMFTKGFHLGVDFTGGRTYVVRFDQPVKTVAVQENLGKVFGDLPEVKTFGPSNQIKVTTKYMMDANASTQNVDSIVQSKLYEGLKPMLNNADVQAFNTKHLQSSEKVGPAIADDLKSAAILAVIFSLIGIFLYIFVRFRSWEFGVGGVVSLAHDALFVMGAYSLLPEVMPFSMEIDQSFIAAILTVIGYSINDTVIVYDRIREHTVLYPKRGLKELYNTAINSTLGRTMNTSLTVLFVLIVIFIFGGEVIRGFIFALLVGVGVGTYSSVLIATPIVYDTVLRRNRKKAAVAKK
jgi:SecD/SecF fusion protein